MVEFRSVNTLRAALAPVEALRGEQSEMESWVYDSLAAIDSLHGELSEWQRDLTRQQAALDQRQAAADDAAGMVVSVAVIESRLAEMLEANRQLEDENDQQSSMLESLKRRLSAAQAENRVLIRTQGQLKETFETARRQAIEERARWADQLAEARHIVDRQEAVIDALAGGSRANVAQRESQPLYPEGIGWVRGEILAQSESLL